jgi:hypothetical protein
MHLWKVWGEEEVSTYFVKWEKDLYERKCEKQGLVRLLIKLRKEYR